MTLEVDISFQKTKQLCFNIYKPTNIRWKNYNEMNKSNNETMPVGTYMCIVPVRLLSG